MEHKKNTDMQQYLNFELSSSEEIEFKNSDTYKKYEQILEGLNDTKPIPFDETTILSNIKAKKSTKNKIIPLYKKWKAVSIAASIILCCFSFYIYTLKPVSHQTTVGESLQVSLPDASLVWLNAKSEISHHKDWKKSRDIELNGEAYFEVAKGKKFTVKTPQGSVSVLGTKFNVKQRDDFFEVHCFEGSVAVNYKNSKTILKANDVFYSKEVKKQQNEHNKPYWMVKKSVFKNTHLKEVLKDISLHYAIDFKSPESITSLRLKYTGSYEYNDDLQTVLDVVCASLNLSYTIKNKVVYLSTK